MRYKSKMLQKKRIVLRKPFVKMFKVSSYIWKISIKYFINLPSKFKHFADNSF